MSYLSSNFYYDPPNMTWRLIRNPIKALIKLPWSSDSKYENGRKASKDYLSAKTASLAWEFKGFRPMQMLYARFNTGRVNKSLFSQVTNYNLREYFNVDEINGEVSEYLTLHIQHSFLFNWKLLEWAIPKMDQTTDLSLTQAEFPESPIFSDLYHQWVNRSENIGPITNQAHSLTMAQGLGTGLIRKAELWNQCCKPASSNTNN